MDSIQIQSAPMVNVRVTSSLNNFMAEKRFDRGLTVAALKMRLEMVTGASSGTMAVAVFDADDKRLFELNLDDALLGSHCIEDGYRLHVTDNSKTFGEFEDLSKVDKFEISDNAYDQKSDTVRSFLRRNQLGKYNEQEMAALREQETRDRELEESRAAAIKEGQRCEVRVQGFPTRRGTVRFVGRTAFKAGLWVGVQYDEPLGKGDGSVDGQRYFSCPNKYGGFARPASVTVGDFPEEDWDEEM